MDPKDKLSVLRKDPPPEINTAGIYSLKQIMLVDGPFADFTLSLPIGFSHDIKWQSNLKPIANKKSPTPSIATDQNTYGFDSVDGSKGFLVGVTNVKSQGPHLTIADYDRYQTLFHIYETWLPGDILKNFP
jgi:hypothetical protein